MTETTLREIVHRAVRDGSYRAQLQSDPASALAGFSLAAEERAAITSGDPARLTALGIDQRMSKAFAAGVLGDASKVIALDPGVAGGTVVDEATGSVMQPMWRIERDLDTASATVDADAAFDANGLRPLERDAEMAAPATRLEDAAGTEVMDLNQDANWDSSGIMPSEY